MLNASANGTTVASHDWCGTVVAPCVPRHPLLVCVDVKHAVPQESDVTLADCRERPRDIRSLALAGDHPEGGGLKDVLRPAVDHRHGVIAAEQEGSGNNARPQHHRILDDQEHGHHRHQAGESPRQFVFIHPAGRVAS